MTQLMRYAIVGLLSNLAGYLLYLLVTWAGVEPKQAMTALYLAGATLGFAGNRLWAFSYRGGIASNVIRYVLAHAAGYLLNLALLVIFADRLGYPHQAVQAVAVLVVALFLFLLFRLFVFPVRTASEGGRP